MTEMHPKTAQESKSARPQAAEMSGRLFARISSVVPQAMFPWQWLTGFPGCANLSARPLSMLWIQERRKNCGTRKKAGPLSRGSKATGLPRSPRAFFWVFSTKKLRTQEQASLPGAHSRTLPRGDGQRNLHPGQHLCTQSRLGASGIRRGSKNLYLGCLGFRLVLRLQHSRVKPLRVQIDNPLFSTSLVDPQSHNH